MPPIEHAALPNSLLERFNGMDTQSQSVLPSIFGTTFKARLYHLR